MENPYEGYFIAGIVGSRRRTSGPDYQQLDELVQALFAKHEKLAIVSGGCYKGADHVAEELAEKYGIEIIICYPDVEYGAPLWIVTQAMHKRNRRIASICTELYAQVASDRTGGTENTIKYAIEFGKPVHILE